MKKAIVPILATGIFAALGGTAQAQPAGYYSQPPRQSAGGFTDRTGRMTAGVSLGVGGMSVGDESVRCSNCTTNPAAFAIAAHIGGVLSPQFALMLEVQVNTQTVEEQTYDTIFLTQSAAMVAAQYWVSPRLWLKGGIGFAKLSNTASSTDAELVIDNGGAALFGAGYELLSNRHLAIDLQGRFIVGSYDGINAKTSSGTVGVGINWF
ncbi:MAG TPA: hypothetical protein PLF40_09860 [Kofleriaceae bacterium]|nr:hypothetical protein [Kofleriaceae bacterium]